MVLLYTHKQPPKNKKTFITHILDLDYQGVGVAKVQGKTWFIENALPGEKVEVRIIEEKRQYGQGSASKILQTNPKRQQPKCPYYGKCGGCQSQHIPLELQRETKQKALFQRLTKLQPQAMLMPMLTGEQWHYRRRVKLSMKYNQSKNQLDIGFRQKNSQQIIHVQQCDVLENVLSQLIPKLHNLFAMWSTPNNLGHIELVKADNGIAMLLRHSGNLSKTDRSLLLEFAEKQQLMLFLQDDHQLQHVYGQLPYYQLDKLQLHFDVRDFIQVNPLLNSKMVNMALDWLELKETDHVLDLFCGMGNFTIPLSYRAQHVVGIEGVEEMVHKARKNAEQNQRKNVQFYQADLDKSFADQSWATQQFNKILLDPPRSGAAFALKALCELNAEKILYVSCNPATLIRDTEILQQFGYRLKKVAMIDMFPNTGHLESVSLFEKE
ncbi:23S rRNA (uracil(1939)-C(5))-methyltransferase RlmD [Pasteurella canis]|uniref:23S rRNA (uracil(1939)-C(5))-methyltransferase RlmD n=1 Tax=Pasteurella canis TaxID=753 RepID=A0ABQ4VIP3_9PAST|nr:23S rRNA (uracil(1939)-C(5))-methyltransferase RlmD [Pasteurella canis]UAX42103.1 23S rRNA (uracil(1939)-C(5))-methyltransferase RlmD [Pasteurella canis]UAY77657.1 23S rRNA (uracil(1939)-C(5))-methyltransferase RlmD [Pasteurella canis]UEA16749.1 23S rRNA (uracil(1939)-C(5))-methyltransferase RlmD [Pasteurella canis]UEC23188.1 23S rRNA (uracil(1939)-C(5))-methyltransferase RlmD [Pasteurella canis]GJH42152.1 23S rRNA (uracil(1939)-C(5))-methyltransferase RlmD [Pasteurella canis]